MRFLLFPLGIGVGIVGIGSRAEAKTIRGAHITTGLSVARIAASQPFNNVWTVLAGSAGSVNVPPPGPHPLSRVQRRYPY
jgi:hypothetical protein